MMSTWFDKNFKILPNYAKLFNNGGQSYVRMQNSLFSGPTNNWNWSLEKKCIEMRVFFAKKKKKVILFISVWPMYIYWEKLQKRSLFSCTIGWGLQQKKRIYASTKVNIKRKVKICLQQGQRPGILFLKLFWSTVRKICSCDRKKIESGLKFVWDTYVE